MTSRSATRNTAQINAALLALRLKQPTGKLSEKDFSVYVTDDGSTLNTTERAVTLVPAPAARIPEDHEVFDEEGLPRHAFLKDHFFNEGRLSPQQVLKILAMATKCLLKEPTLLEVPAPVTICGDIHGQYYDLMRLFDVGGSPELTPYLFLGDYVDRGLFSIECLLYLYSLKLNFPTTLWMLRGNHECRHLTEYFTFKSECLHKYSEEVYEAALKSFNALPLTAIVLNLNRERQFFCVHGGLLPDLKLLDDLMKLDRFREPPTRGLMCDLLWADPCEDYDEDEGLLLFSRNTVRGCSYAFTYKALCQFLERTGLLLIIRAHEAQDAGYRMYKPTKTMLFPSLLTMFSAPNYLDTYNNKAAVLKYENNVMNIRQFNALPHPYWLPNFMDVFTWSLPFVGEKITDMMVLILNICTEEELDEDTPLHEDRITTDTPAATEAASAGLASTTASSAAELEAEMEHKRTVLRNKVLAIGRMLRMYKILREELEQVAHLKELNRGQLPKGSLINGLEGLRHQISLFADARQADLRNEALPPLVEEQRRREEARLVQMQEQLENDEHDSKELRLLVRRLSQK